MKKYRDLLSELPSKSVVVTYGRFNPPSTGHELIIKVVRKLAKQRKADHIVFVSTHQDKKNPLEISKKIQYLELMFPNTRFIAAKEDLDCIGSLSKYKNVVMVTSSDSANAYKKLLKRGKFETTEVIEAVNKDPDSDDKNLKAASKGNIQSLKSGLPTTVRELDAKRLMNDIRIGLGLDPIKEQINLVKDDLREKYFRGEIFNEGDIVESEDKVYKIIKRGSNHLLLQTESGDKVSKWIQDVQLTGREFMLDEKQLQEADATSATGQMAAVKKAETQSKMAMLAAKQAKEVEDLKKKQAREADAEKAQVQESKFAIPKSLMSLHDFRKTMSMGVKGVDQKAMDDKETESDMDASTHATSAPQHSITGGQHMDAGKDESLRRMRAKYHLGEETEEQQDTRAAQLKRFKQQAAEAKLGTVAEANYKGLEKEDKPGEKKTEFKGSKNAVKGETVEGWKDEEKPCSCKEEFGIEEEELIGLVESDLDSWTEDDMIELYDEEELAIIDEDTGEEIEAVAEEVELDAPALMEVLSRMERIKAKARMRRSKAKRERREKVALRQLSTPQVANKRARRMAISAMKKRLLRGQNPQKVSVGQKERVERFIQQRRKIVDRLAARMVSRVKQVEKARMSHKKFTKPNNGVSF